jgi:hypothetical protein
MQFQSKSCLNDDIFACREPRVVAAIAALPGQQGPGYPFPGGLIGDAE